jgi:lysophospholipase L1-like esterase
VLYALAALLVLAVDFLCAKVLQRQKSVFLERRLEVERSYRVSSEDYHHGFKANVDIDPVYWGRQVYSMKTNSLAFRDVRVRNVSLKPTQKRIVLIGDSFTEGIGVEFQKTFAGILQEAFTKQDTEVLNAAASSYSPWIYYSKIKHLIERQSLEFDHLVVFLDISDIQDEVLYEKEREGSSKTKNGNASAPDPGGRSLPLGRRFQNFLLENSLFFNFVKMIKDKVVGTPVWTVLDLDRSLWTLSPEKFQEYGERGLELGQKHMDLLWRLLKHRGIRLSLVVYPWPDQIMNRDLRSKQVQVWQIWAAERSVDFLDLFPEFIQENQTSTDAVRMLRARFIPGDMHWNEAGHRAVADALLRWPELRESLPPLR